jgi:hypothetical protein
MSDSGANGWSGATLLIENSTQSTILSTTMIKGAFKQQWICLSTDCYTVVISSTDAEISWKLEVCSPFSSIFDVRL